jgi:purine-binding chemotaxis protein CheW
VSQELSEILVFELAGQRFGLPAAIVQELLRAVRITPVPRGSKLVEGIINLRGSVVPVFDLRRWFGLPAKALEPSDHLIVVRADQRLLATRVDRALELVRVGADQVEPGPAGGEAAGGVAKLPGGMVLLSDLKACLERVDAFPAEPAKPASGDES